MTGDTKCQKGWLGVVMGSLKVTGNSVNEFLFAFHVPISYTVPEIWVENCRSESAPPLFVAPLGMTPM